MSELNERLGFGVRDGLRFCINGTFADANPVRIDLPTIPPTQTQGGIRVRVYNPSATASIGQADVAVAVDGTPGPTPTVNATPGNPACGEIIGPGLDMYYAYAGQKSRDLWLVGTAGQSWQVSGNVYLP